MTSVAQKAIDVIAAVLGLVILAPFCALKAWEDCMSTENPFGRAPRQIDRWRWHLLNVVYGNPEDGVSGAQAMIWTDGKLGRNYMPDAGPRWRAYCWSAWRNSADQLKYTFHE